MLTDIPISPKSLIAVAFLVVFLLFCIALTEVFCPGLLPKQCNDVLSRFLDVSLFGLKRRPGTWLMFGSAVLSTSSISYQNSSWRWRDTDLPICMAKWAGRPCKVPQRYREQRCLGKKSRSSISYLGGHVP